MEPTNGDNSNLDEFYLQLKEEIDRIPGGKYDIFKGKLNDQVGRNRNMWYQRIGKLGVRKETSDDYRLLQFCKYNNLDITNTVCGHKMARKLKWYLHAGKKVNLLMM